MKAFPSSLFLRSYLAIVLGILFIALALDGLLAWLVPEPAGGSAGAYGGSFALMQQALSETPGHSLEEAFKARQEAFSHALGAPVTLYRKADFAGLEAFEAGLREGAIISLYDTGDRETLYQEIPHTERVLAVGPLPRSGSSARNLEFLVITSYYFLVAFIVFLWIRPFYRDLSILRAAATEFGRNDFSSRVELPPGSSILPMAQSFNTMAERIQYLVSAHRELTNAVSHELRTPLARFKFSMEILAKTDDPVKKEKYLANMKDDVQELESLIDEMLSYARLSEDNLRLDLVEVNLKAWLQGVVDTYAGESINIQYSFSTLDPDNNYFASFNPDLMARAVHNVLRNCLRYAQSAIAISAQLSDTEALLKICDDGPGIPPDKQESIFEPFSRLDTSRDKRSGGYGLGLAIARRILERHKGSIKVTNSAPNGACFTLRWKR